MGSDSQFNSLPTSIIVDLVLAFLNTSIDLLPTPHLIITRSVFPGDILSLIISGVSPSTAATVILQHLRRSHKVLSA